MIIYILLKNDLEINNSSAENDLSQTKNLYKLKNGPFLAEGLLVLYIDRWSLYHEL